MVWRYHWWLRRQRYDRPTHPPPPHPSHSQRCIILEKNFGFMPYELLLDIWYMPLRIALFIDNYDFMTTCVLQYLRLNNVRLCNSTYDTLIVCPSFSTPCSFCPSFSSRALLFVIFQSYKFQPCTFVRHFQSCIFLSCKFSRPVILVKRLPLLIRSHFWYR